MKPLNVMFLHEIKEHKNQVYGTKCLENNAIQNARHELLANMPHCDYGSYIKTEKYYTGVRDSGAVIIGNMVIVENRSGKEIPLSCEINL